MGENEPHEKISLVHNIPFDNPLKAPVSRLESEIHVQKI